MFQLGKTIVSEDLIEKDFVCNLGACKGECCISGEAGAPVSKEETEILEQIYLKVKPFLRPEGIKAIEEQGTFITTSIGELETPLVEGKECAYVTFTESGIASCGIEDAINTGNSGLLIDANKTNAFIEGIIQILQNPTQFKTEAEACP